MCLHTWRTTIQLNWYTFSRLFKLNLKSHYERKIIKWETNLVMSVNKSHNGWHNALATRCLSLKATNITLPSSRWRWLISCRKRICSVYSKPFPLRAVHNVVSRHPMLQSIWYASMWCTEESIEKTTPDNFVKEGLKVGVMGGEGEKWVWDCVSHALNIYVRCILVLHQHIENGVVFGEMSEESIRNWFTHTFIYIQI